MAKEVRHGGRFTRAYSIWTNMKTRCNNPDFKDAKYYSEKGRTYEPRWEFFENFLIDMGEPPAGLTLDRKDNNLGYTKENCRWVTPLIQGQNRNQGKFQGVRFEKKRHFTGAWTARVTESGKRLELYRGPDFFEACCARKSWENKK